MPAHNNGNDKPGFNGDKPGFNSDKPGFCGIFKKTNNWKNLIIYQKANVLYQMTVSFCDRFLPHHGDRTVDQMVQAARSGKQNIVEGSGWQDLK